MKKFLIILLAVSLCLMAASVSLAADTKAKTTTPSKTATKTASTEGNIGIGTYDTGSAWGASINYRLSKDLSIQGILAPIGYPVAFYGAKANFTFLKPDPAVGVYGFGMAGLADDYFWGSGLGLGFGGGAGVEYFPGKMFDLGNANYKKIGFMVELGVNNMMYNGWDNVGFGLSFSCGAHYYF